MLPPEKDDEPERKDEGEETLPESGSPEEPYGTGDDGRRETGETLPEEPAVTATPDHAAAPSDEAAGGRGRREDADEEIGPHTEPRETAVREDEAQPAQGADPEGGRTDAAATTDETAQNGGDLAQPRETAAEADDPALREDEAQTDQRPEAAGDRTDPALTAGPKQSDPAADRERAPQPPSPSARSSGGGFLPALLAAIIGGLIGAGGVWYFLQQQEAPGPDPEVVAALEEQRGETAAQADRLAAIEDDIGSLNEALNATDIGDAIEQLRIDAEGRFEGVAEAVAAAAERLDAVERRLDQADEQIAELEARPIADPETATQALRSEIAEMREEVEQATEAARAQVETMRANLAAAAEETQEQILAAEERAAELEAQAQERIRAAEAEAEALARRAEAEAALARIEAALDSGEPYPDALATLRENAETEVPEVLVASADTGVPTIAELREAYPDAARAALNATAVATTEGDPANRLVAFLRTQTQARSLTPREGDSPDAILSRAEAALEDGDVSAALAELEALPEDGRAAMQDWLDAARQRAEAVEAARTLLQDMN